MCVSAVRGAAVGSGEGVMPIINGEQKGKDAKKANKEIVHCFECVHYKKMYSSDLCSHCELFLQTDGKDYANRRVPADGYCWAGEKKNVV